MVINVKEIAELGWIKNWYGEFSLFSCSFTGDFYFKASVNSIGEGIHCVLYVHKNGITACYLGKSEMTKFGEFLAEKAVADNEFLNILARRLKEENDNVLKLIEDPVESFLDNNKFQKFVKGLEVYQPFQVGTKAVVNYLPQELGEKFIPLLEDARKYSEKFYDEIEKFLRKFATLIGEKEGYESKLILCLYKDELVHYLETNNLPEKEILEKRYKLSGLFFDDGKRQIIGNEVEELEHEIAKLSGLATGKVTGDTASPGLVKGICRIINDPLNFKEFNKGDILVTGMTRPDFVPLIEKAAAIVTDAGGILCHAAIVSREMKIPCIVGTETATKSFKDGDLLEVNATEGVVKKID